MKKIVIMLIHTVLILQAMSVHAQSLPVTIGASWLSQTQNADGTWCAQQDLAVICSAESMNVLMSSGATTSYTSSLNWLASQSAMSTDELSRTITALATSGTNSATLVTTLVNNRNADGSWGYKLGDPSNSLDTALALQALRAANYSDYSVLFSAINFLTTNQNPDGGWGFKPTSGALTSDPSNAYVTAMVLRALAAHSSQFIVQTNINNAKAYLLTKQNTDGGFGSSPSNVYETALSVMALIESGSTGSPQADQSDIQSLQNGINYLTSTQLSNGSWENDPYKTALALQALAAARPNLTLSSISLSKSMPQAGENVTITATVNNTGLDSASGAVVRFFLGDPAAGGTQIGTDQILSSLAVSSTAYSSITASFSVTGGKTIFAVVDPDNLISETSKADNKTSTRVWVATGPDLAVYSEDLKPSTYVPASGTAFTLEYKVRNLGESASDGFDATVYDGNPASGGTVLQTVHISGLIGSEIRTGTFGVTLSANGPHTLYVVADSNQAVTELSETNNTATITVQVGGTETAVDLAVTPMDITLTPSRPTANQTVQIAAKVRNQGQEQANNALVEIFDGAPDAGGTLIYSQAVDLSGGAEQVITTNWTITAGKHDIYVVLDRMNVISESNEGNNTASTRVMTDMVDITISATDLSFTPSHPVSGDSVLLSITAHNSGIKNTGAFNLALYDGDPAQGGQLLRTYPVAGIQGDGTTTVSYAFTAAPGTYRFYAIADTENVVTEMYEENNTAIRSLKVKAPGEILGPDLVPVKIDLTDMTTDPRTLAVGGKAFVTFQNKGDDKITTPFTVSLFEDTDLDGRYTAGVDTLLSSATNTFSLWPEGAGGATMNVSGTVQFLHSPVYAFIDSGDAIHEQDETNNLLVSCKDCKVVPANPIQPVAKWTSKDGNVNYGMPVIANLNGNGSSSGSSSILYTVPIFSGYLSRGRIYVVDGATGNTQFTIERNLQNNYDNISWAGIMSVGDIDGDGLPEIIISKNSSFGLLAYSNTGVLKWDNSDQVMAWINAHKPNQPNIFDSCEPVIADLDGDGKAEIIMGGTVINGDGSIRWVRPLQNPSLGTGQYYYGHYFSIVADLDLDGKQEVIAGHTAYNADGTVKWNANLPDGMNVVGNFDNDPYPEIVLVTATSPATVYLLEHDGKIKWGPIVMDYFWSAPVIADFDGDGETEIGIRRMNYLWLLDKNGNLKKQIYVPYNPNAIGNAMHTPPTVFDLNGDGRPEVLFSSDNYFRIYDGKEGTLLYQESFNSIQPFQGVLIADVDNDGQAEAVLPRADFGGSHGAVRVYGSKNHDWVGARPIWNQFSYHVTNVNDDGTIPQHETPSWLLHNAYRVQAPVGTVTNPYLTPNLTASRLSAAQNGSSVDLAVRIGNGGAKEAASGAVVTFYDGDPSANVVIGTASTTRTLAVGEYQDVILSVSGVTDGLHHINAVVNGCSNGSNCSSRTPECNYDDNKASVDITVSLYQPLPDLAIGSENIAIPAGAITEGALVPVQVNVRNIGGAVASNVSVRLYNGNPASGGTAIGLSQTILFVAGGGSASVAFTFDTLGHAGRNVLYVVLDQDNSIVETSESNNLALVSIDVQAPTLPNLTISPENIQISPASPKEGESVTVTGTITNRGAAAGAIPVGIAVRSSEPGVGSEVYSQTKTIYQTLGLGQSATVSTTIDTTGLAGQKTVFVTVDPANTITESNETDNSAAKSLFIQQAGLTVSVALDKPTYQANEQATSTITVADLSGVARTLGLNILVKDSAGNLIATIASAEPVTINPNGSVVISKTWNTGKTLNGNYLFATEVTESTGGRIIAKASAGFTISPDKTIASKVVVDKTSYNPNDTAALTATITSQSLNYAFENLSAKLTIRRQTTDDRGQITTEEIYTDTRTISTLMPGAVFTFKSYWNTGTWPGGAYQVSLEVKDSSGTVIATASTNVVISTIVKPSRALRGQLSVDKQSIMNGDPVNVSYSVTNVGNSDLPNVALSVKTVHVKQTTVFDNLLTQANLDMGGTYTGSGTVNTTKYSAMDYLVVLQASIDNGPEETLAGTYFRVEGAPTEPSLASPASASDVQILTPTLTVNNASDPNDDKLFYEFEIYGDSGLSLLIASTGGIAQGAGITSWQVPFELTENSTYVWRSRAFDGKLYGEWMQPASFRVNVANDPPTAPVPTSPANASAVPVFQPVLAVTNATDPDSTGLTYNFEVYADAAMTNLIAAETGVGSQETGGITTWTVPTALTENTWYWWRAHADDWFITGPWSAVLSFFVNTSNDAPTVPVILSPSNNSVVASLNADITVRNSTDPDSSVITYFFEIDTVPTFDSAMVKRSGPVESGQVVSSWQAAELLENTQYYVRAKASDGSAESTWSPAIGFFVNTVNDLPTTPAIANPSNGAGVTTFTPTLVVRNSTDPDRDGLTYEFELYTDSAMTNMIANAFGVPETVQTTSWIEPVTLTENRTYWWRARASDGSLTSGWTLCSSFTVNTANDAPTAPVISAPADGSSLATRTPTLTVLNATDPDSDKLTYDFEVYAGDVLVAYQLGVWSQESGGMTSWTVPSELADNSQYQWRSRAYDGDRYGPWTAMADFTVHLPATGINATINFDPDTLNQGSNGTWVVVYIELPAGYDVRQIDLSSIRLERSIPAETRPIAIGDQDKDGATDLMVKFKRSEVIAILPAGEMVPVQVTGKVGTTTFEGVDVVRVIK